MPAKTIAIIGAGPGGLSAAMLLAHRGHKVVVFEKNADVGGRNAALKLGRYTFDLGPTFHLMPQVLERVFALAGRRTEDCLTMKRIDPLYRLRFPGKPDFLPCVDREEMVRRIDALFPGDGEGFRRYMRREAVRAERMIPCLEVPYGSPWNYLRPRMLRALPHLDAHRSVYDVVSRYFRHEEMRIAMTFQAKYLGMSPWQCPGTFAFLSYVEHAWGIFHPIGGLNRISHAMAEVAREEGAEIRLATPVRRIVVRDGAARGVELESGERFDADEVVVNADFAYAMTHLVDAADRRTYTDADLARRPYSCSTFMLYLGLRGRYEIPHHNIIFARDYRRNVEEIVGGVLSEDFSFYLQNASVTDPTLAPDGHSTLYVLVPVPNTGAPIDWERRKDAFAERVLSEIERRTELSDLRSRIEVSRAISPLDWERDANVYRGAVFNLAHSVDQMLYFRPHNRFEEFGNCTIVGGGTHPGSGLPTILQSGMICADLIGAA